MLFIGTQFSILYTSMYSPAEAATPVCVCITMTDFSNNAQRRCRRLQVLEVPYILGVLVGGSQASE